MRVLLKPLLQGCLQAAGKERGREDMGMWDIYLAKVDGENVPETSLKRVPLVDEHIQIRSFDLLMNRVPFRK